MSPKTDQPEARISTAYRILFARPPSVDEQQLGNEFIAEQGLKQYIHTLMCTNEFIHLN